MRKRKNNHKTAIIVLAVVALAGTASLLYSANRHPKQKPEHQEEAPATPQKTEPYPVGHFDSMDVASSVDVRYTVGPKVSLQANGPEEDLKYLIVKVEKGVLKIDRQYPVGYHRTNYDGIEIKLTAPAVEKINLSGTATLTVDSAAAFTNDKLSLSLEGATRATFIGNVRVHDVSVSVSGASKAVMDALTSSSATVNTTGSSTCNINGLRADALKATTSGASKITLNGTAGKSALISSGASSINAKGLTSRAITVSSTGASEINR